MNFLNKITFKNIANYSLIFFSFGIFPLIALLLFYNPAVSILGLLFSYISMTGSIFVMYLLFFTKDKFFLVAEFISQKINTITNENIVNSVKIAVKGVALLISIGIVYISFSIGSLFLNAISLISVLNPLMILALNIYYICMALVFSGDNQ